MAFCIVIGVWVMGVGDLGAFLGLARVLVSTA